MSAKVKPVALGLEPSFGFGDRLGLATPGHLDAVKALAGPILPIFAQQSIREMTRTKRTPQDVMAAATKALQANHYNDPWGADADHLKTQEDVDLTAAAGFIFFTIDPSDHVDQQADNYDPAALETKFKAVEAEVNWVSQYEAQSLKIKGRQTLKFDTATVRRAAVKYGRAINHTIKLASYIQFVTAKAGQDCEIELSIDETLQPTTPAEHYIIADQCIKAGANLVSIAPRFIGDLEKGVDYKGDLKAFTKSLTTHANIARTLGPYKLSLHSGSDKLSIYATLAQITQGLFHVKTAGTSYLEALRVVARHEPKLFRQIVDFARAHYDADKLTYHVSATLASAPAPAEVPSDAQLEELYLQTWAQTPVGIGFTQPGRQILHCTFGSVVNDPTLGPSLKSLLQTHPDTHRQILAEHLGKHLEALRQGM